MSVASIVDSQLTKLSLNGSDVIPGGLALGQGAGLVSQDISSVAVGLSAGQANQGLAQTEAPFLQGECVAIGIDAGRTSQYALSVAIGAEAGMFNQGATSTSVTGGFGQCVAIGYQAGMTGQQSNSIAIGAYCAKSGQQDNAIAIGVGCAQTGQAYGSICIDTSTNVSPSVPNACYIRPLRALPSAGLKSVYYNSTTGELSFVP